MIWLGILIGAPVGALFGWFFGYSLCNAGWRRRMSATLPKTATEMNRYWTVERYRRPR